MKFVMIKSKKSQAAMEFLMTYGWAILVVLAAIAALAYFGVLSPEKFLPEKCLMATGFNCLGNKIEPTQSTIVLQNSLGKSITIQDVKIGTCEKTEFDQVLQSEDDFTFLIDPVDCDNGLLKEVFKGEIIIRYTERNTGLNKTAYGSINTKIE